MVASLSSNRSSNKPRVKAQSPPNVSIHERDPNTRDYFNFTRGDIWINLGTTALPVLRVWILMRQAANVATWILLASGANGDISQLTASDGTVALPVLGNITFPAGHNIFSNVNPNFGPNFTVNVTNAITLGDLAPINTAITSYASTNDNFGSYYLMRKDTAGAIVNTAADLGALFFQGFDGATYQTGAIIKAVTEGVPAIGNIPSNIRFSTKPDSVNPIAERFRISADGQVTVFESPEFNPATQKGLLVVNGSESIIYKGVNALGPVTSFAKNRGAANPNANDDLGHVNFGGIETASGTYIASSIVGGQQVGAINNGSIPGILYFGTTPVLGIGPTIRMTISNAGNVVVNAPDAGVAFNVTGSVGAGGDNGGTAGFNTVTNGTVASGVGVNTLTGTAIGGGGKNNDGYIKIYVNGVAAYIPYYLTP